MRGDTTAVRQALAGFTAAGREVMSQDVATAARVSPQTARNHLEELERTGGATSRLARSRLDARWRRLYRATITAMPESEVNP